LRTTTFQKERDSVKPCVVSVLIYLAWSSSTICLDPNEYDDPTRFYPERFINEDLYKPLAGHWAFGMGRRGYTFANKLMTVCVGYVLAIRNLWIAMAKMAYCFDVAHPEVHTSFMDILMAG
jgi:cytochrome P450